MLKRTNVDPPPGRNVARRLEDPPAAEASAAPTRLPEDLHAQLAGRDYEGWGDAVEAFVLDGTIPTDDEERGDVAEWCITERLPEHFALVPATRLGIALGMRDVDEAAAECLGRANNLRDLILSMAVPTDGDGMATAIVAALQCPTLERLILADAAEMALEALRSALESNHGLKELELQWDRSYPHLALRDGTLLGEILQTHPPLNTLRLDGCNSGATGPCSPSSAPAAPCRSCK